MQSDSNTSTLTAETRRTLGEQAAGRIRELIVSGRLPAGTRVSHDELAAELGISRLPLRDAFIMLEREGWVVVRRGRGTYVNEINSRTVIDNFTLYGLLLGLAVEFAVKRGSADLADRLADIRRAFVNEDDPARGAQLAIAFNRAILQAADSPRLRSSLRALRGFPLGDVYRLIPAIPEAQAKAMARIVKGVRAKDSAQAADAYSKLMKVAHEELSTLLRQQGLLNDPGGDSLDEEDDLDTLTHLS